MGSILYLGVEGVLFRAHVPHHNGHHAARGRHPAEPLPLLKPLSEIADTNSDLRIVLNSWLVADYGFRQLLRSLPASIASRTIGATIRGNRLHRCETAFQARADLLRADVSRRDPSRLTIIDASRSAIPPEYDSRAICVDSQSNDAVIKLTAQLHCLLMITDSPESIYRIHTD